MYAAVNTLSYGSITKESAQPHFFYPMYRHKLSRLPSQSFNMPSVGLYLFTHWVHKQ